MITNSLTAYPWAVFRLTQGRERLKKVLVFLFIAFCANSFAEPDETFLKNNEFSKNLLSDFTDKFSTYESIISEQDVETVENFLRQRDPQLVASMQGENIQIKWVMYKNRIIDIAFNEYEQAFVARLKEKSAQTGRQLKRRAIRQDGQCTMITTYWLDNGELDSDKCQIPKGMSLKDSLEWERKHACFYPDGYEEHSIIIQKSLCRDKFTAGDHVDYIWATDDYKEQNLRIDFQISMNGDNASENINVLKKTSIDHVSRLKLDLAQWTNEYDRYYNWRNLEIEDIRAGMWEYGGYVTHEGERMEHAYVDMNKDWKSKTGMPVGYVRSRDFYYSQNWSGYDDE